VASNTCPNCRHSFRSRHHAVHCGKKSLQQWHASKIGHQAHRGQYTPRRTAGEIFASQSIGNVERGTAIQMHIETQEAQL